MKTKAFRVLAVLKCNVFVGTRKKTKQCFRLARLFDAVAAKRGRFKTVSVWLFYALGIRTHTIFCKTKSCQKKRYQDKDVCKQVDNIDCTYSMERLEAMYNYLSSHGECCYISYNNILIGDVSLTNEYEVAIVISKAYQNMHIGRKCVGEIIKIAKEKGAPYVKARIYSFNEQSRKMFLSLGFLQTDEETYILDFKNCLKS